ncbi:hypothetical protein PsorP6_010353 [Peronosclerospora sorghi]|uniref:Uncharacterized protein n=1 Tax=Peronosclerospora sorghi TaxID=230839 RepID=A0ACC0VXF0_9STRA|nr:hypothetical protein PsorP6_010353 [Peronosclerospora sorghi]
MPRPRLNAALRAQDMPPHFRHLDGLFTNSRGQKLSYLALFPPLETPLRAVVVYLHGIGDHSRRYFHLYEHLCRLQIGVFAYDLLSHGKSESDHPKRRAHSSKFHHFVDDTNDFLSFLQTKLYAQLQLEAKPKLLLAGLSFGTLVGLHTVLCEKHTFHGIILIAPALLVEMTLILKVQALFARPLSKLFPKARIVPGVNHKYLCRDPDFVDNFMSDPLTVSTKLTARMGAETLKAMKALAKEKRVEEKGSVLCHLPLLMMMGSDDKVTSLELAQTFYDRLATSDKEFKIFDGYYHALFDDPESDAVFAHLEKWIQKTVPLPEEEQARAVDDTVKMRL